MAQVSYRDLLPDIRQEVFACPVPTMVRAVGRAARQFFEESQAWVVTVSGSLAADTELVTVATLPTDTRIVVPLEMWVSHSGRKIPLKTANRQMIAHRFYGTEQDLTDKHPEYVMLADHSMDQLQIAPKLKTGADPLTISGTVAVKPTRDATGMEESILDEFSEGLVAGALSILFSMKNTEWHDPQMSGVHGGIFRREMEKAGDYSRKANTSRLMTTGYGGI